MTLKEFKQIYDKLYVSLCLFSNEYVHDLDLSKDIVQDVFIKVWEKQVPYICENTIRSFLYTSVKNKSLDHLKSKRVKITDALSDKEVEIVDNDSVFLKEVAIAEISSHIDKAIDTLPKKCAVILRLSISEHTNVEIAEKLNVSIDTVKYYKKIGYEKLRPLLKNYHLLFLFIKLFGFKF
ncbi:RNA polymerase sigma-70 factor [Flavobacterium sp. FlaQc-48]|uniref:RNA polymerase sigma-70 factor n=1 Tax=Flavobacterium sp. FlaQc-48 TaxID=3374181 RepID=UPI003757B69E